MKSFLAIFAALVVFGAGSVSLADCPNTKISTADQKGGSDTVTTSGTKQEKGSDAKQADCKLDSKGNCIN